MNLLRKWEELLMELATRKDNQHVGSGLGGNIEQFLALVSVTPAFVSDQTDLFKLDNLNLFIDTNKFNQVSKKELRKEMDNFLTSDVLGKLILDSNLLESFIFKPKNPPSHFDVCSLPSDSGKLHPKQLNLIKTCSLAKKLHDIAHREFVTKSPSSFDDCPEEFRTAALALSKSEPFEIVIACRMFIGIETLVQFNMDELIGFILEPINKRMQG